MKDELISYETAVMAKEKGFDLEGYKYFLLKKDSFLLAGRGYSNDWNRFSNRVSAPTQSLLQKWLRDKYKIHVKLDDFIDDETGVEWDFELVEIGTDLNEKGEYTPLIPYSLDDKDRKFKSYEQALERGLQEGLRLIK